MGCESAFRVVKSEISGWLAYWVTLIGSGSGYGHGCGYDAKQSTMGLSVLARASCEPSSAARKDESIKALKH